MKQERSINKLLDTINWKLLPENVLHDGVLPYATHEGVLKVGDFEFHVLQLNTGERVFTEDEVKAFFGLIIGIE